MSAPKFCKDCRHCVVPQPGAYDLAKCHKEKKPDPEYLVSGKPQADEWFYCSSRRNGGTCGVEARDWTPK